MTPLSREQVRRVDQLATERYGLIGLVLMENAGRNAAAVMIERFGTREKALIACGPGNNGGDGLVIARHLHNAGWGIRLVVTAESGRMSPDARTNFGVVAAMRLPVISATRVEALPSVTAVIDADTIIVDALLGTGFRGSVRSPMAELISALCDVPCRARVAVDVPSGLDADTGEAHGPAFRAQLTVTFVAPKIGFASPSAADYVGRVVVADIGVPRELVSEIAG